jgi:hypothetical protein
MMSTQAEVHKAVRLILDDKKSYSTSLNWAVGYCRAALQMSGEELRVQILYILNNISHWRNKDAKEVRTILRAYKGGA